MAHSEISLPTETIKHQEILFYPQDGHMPAYFVLKFTYGSDFATAHLSIPESAFHHVRTDRVEIYGVDVNPPKAEA